ncbi:unnamed protein product, partial [Mesorhabditis belari]|uniref:Uncharacterized protein n=1 Tax=Mesorhabditis belari TaxID=2138241 RepID=A0AAF3F2C5_9BILA
MRTKSAMEKIGGYSLRRKRSESAAQKTITEVSRTNKKPRKAKSGTSVHDDQKSLAVDRTFEEDTEPTQGNDPKESRAPSRISALSKTQSSEPMLNRGRSTTNVGAKNTKEFVDSLSVMKRNVPQPAPSQNPDARFRSKPPKEEKTQGG